MAGLMFRETMKGCFTKASSSRRTGLPGAKAQVACSFTATVVFEDIARLVTGANRLGSLSGRVECRELGIDAEFSGGQFALFQEFPEVLMSYRIPFEVASGQVYVLAGTKVHGGGGLMSFWRDTTTLRTTLCEGAEETGIIVGQGLLRLSSWELARLCLSMRPVGSSGFLAAVSTILEFVTFFAGQLLHAAERGHEAHAHSKLSS